MERKIKEKSSDDRFLKYDFKIGKGSFKTVSLGRDTLMDRDIAWCKIRVSFRRFGEMREARKLESGEM